MELTKHQYDVDTETVIGFLKAHGLDKDFEVNIEVNHATLAGHTFEHELAVAVDNGMLGSIDANRGTTRTVGILTIPIDNYELTQAMMQIIRNGGLGNGGTNFDAKTRRNSTDLKISSSLTLQVWMLWHVLWKVQLNYWKNLLTRRCWLTVTHHSTVARVRNSKKVNCLWKML